MEREVIICPYCNHPQKTKSKLKKITCSSCQKKFPRQDEIKDNDTEIKKGVTEKKVKLD